MKLFTEEYRKGFRSSIQKLSKKTVIDYTNKLDKIEQLDLKKSKFIDRIINYIYFNKQSYITEINKQIDRINEEVIKTNSDLKNIPDFRFIRLHADHTFTSLIPDDLEKNDVFLITNDTNCVTDVINAVNAKGKTYAFKLKIYNNRQFNELKI